MRVILKHFKIIFCNLILIAFLSQIFVNGILTNVAFAETINFPKATKYTSQPEIMSIWQQPSNYYTTTDGNPKNNANFNQDAMIGVQGWHMGKEFSISGYVSQSWGSPCKEFREKLGDSIQTDGNIAYVMDGSDKCYIIASVQAFAAVGEKVNWTYKSQSSGKEVVIHTVYQDTKAPDDWNSGLGWFPEGPYGYYADFWGTNTLEFCGITSVPGDQDFSEFGGGSDSGPWLLTNVENLGGFQGFEPSTQRVSESVAWPGAASSTIQYDIDADFVDLDVREFTFSGLPKTVSYEGYTNPIANLFKNLGRAVDLLFGLLINGLKRALIGWTRIIEIMVNYVFYKTEQSMVENSTNET